MYIGQLSLDVDFTEKLLKRHQTKLKQILYFAKGESWSG